ncbi:hypothetical protein FRX31_029132 [Thalictrum thalictroides]|uniref:Uncharacterized protein n=1 Tax=Thalictrum thalictroides TaxID=46969 RepID=A0A7J6V9K7_THATH|nr:hypothetical protein FRX31_029132 [Thalictrum thalictroides]
MSFSLFFKEFQDDLFLDWHVNTTFLTPIPKVEGPVSISGYRPISLVGGINKMIMKVLASRPRLVLPYAVKGAAGHYISKGPLHPEKINVQERLARPKKSLSLG